MDRSKNTVFTSGSYRLTVFSANCVRIENNVHSKKFEDRPSVVFRERNNYLRSSSFQQFEVTSTEKEGIQLTTPSFRLKIPSSTQSSWTLEYQNKEYKSFITESSALNLGGAIRTLDGAHKKNNRLNLKPGLISKIGFTVIDDSTGLVFNESSGSISKREVTYDDFYLFVYGENYIQCLQEFTHLAGQVPLLPKYTWGVWYSKYWQYKDTDLLEILDSFTELGIPLSVIGVDMDWHIVAGSKTSRGWTGYTWNREFFPNPEQFLRDCHERNVRVYLNLHPADGCHHHELAYPKFAALMGIDPTSESPIPLDLNNPKFMEGYFKYLHHPHQQIGVDFWWIDWQQGDKLKNFPELDPLMYLNHSHWEDLETSLKGQRPLILSRWGGLGNHRYQVGFSGDTIADWSVLEVLPELTAAGANVLFLWSHDVGGFMQSCSDGELLLRWTQFSVFSPVVRFHCMSNPFETRLPWDYEPNWQQGITEALKFRALLLPYIYSLSYLMHLHSIPMVLPLYYSFPKDEFSYKISQEYFFGEQLLIAPFLSKRSPATLLSRQPTYLPPGPWFDYSTGRQYPGKQWFVNYGTILEIPIFAKGGAIIPTLQNPNQFFEKSKLFGYSALNLSVFPCGSSNFTLYEDDGEKIQSEPVSTLFSTEWKALHYSTGNGGNLTFRIHKKKGNIQYCKEECDYHIAFKSVYQVQVLFTTINENPVEVKCTENRETGVFVLDVVLRPTDTFSICMDINTTLKTPEFYLEKDIIKLLKNQQNTPTQFKSIFYRDLPKIVQSRAGVLHYAPQIDKDQMRAWIEIIGDCGYYNLPKLNGDNHFFYWKNIAIPEVKLDSQLHSTCKTFEVLEDDTDSDSDLEEEARLHGTQTHFSEIVVTAAMKRAAIHHIRVAFGNLVVDNVSLGTWKGKSEKEEQEENCIVS